MITTIWIRIDTDLAECMIHEEGADTVLTTFDDSSDVAMAHDIGEALEDYLNRLG